MNYEQLTQVVKLADREQIKNRMTLLGYRDIEKDEKLNSVSFVTIAQSSIEDTEQYLSKDKQYCFDGHRSINNGVAFGIEFITIQTMKYDKKRKMYITSNFDIYAKEITE